MKNLNHLSIDDISQRLAKISQTSCDINYESPHQEGNSSGQNKHAYRHASVLIPFVRIENEWHLLFIRRSESDKDPHSGQVAFVGGKAEDYDDSVEATALRETEEEIGVRPSDVTLLGKLGNHFSASNFQISPIVASLPYPYDFRLDPMEVSHTFTMPLTWLAEEKNYDIRQRWISRIKQEVPVIYFKEYDGELLWGATARMTVSLIKTLRGLAID